MHFLHIAFLFEAFSTFCYGGCLHIGWFVLQMLQGYYNIFETVIGRLLAELTGLHLFPNYRQIIGSFAVNWLV
jgi:hypothetical protein